MTALETLQTFDEGNLPDLDTVVLGALEFFAETPVPRLETDSLRRPLVVGSGNAAVVGKVLFGGTRAVFADESTFEYMLSVYDDIDGVVVISASGSKHAIDIVKEAAGQSVPTFLITTNPVAPAAEYLKEGHVQIFPKTREPYTYNTSTYLGMLLSQTGEDAGAIVAFIEKEVAPVIPDTFSNFDAFFLLVPPEFNALREMFTTKFDELFGPKVAGRVFTLEQTKHAKTVVHSDSEYFISFGEENTLFGESDARLTIPLPEKCSAATMMAIGYYVIGRAQKQLPPYFKEHIESYTKEASEIFGHAIKPIVE